MDLIFKEETYKIIGLCMEVHKQLGHGFSEIVYKDALQHEFKINNIPFEREKQFEIHYKSIILPHYYYADFIVFDEIILEIKACKSLTDDFIAQTLNYLKASGCELGLLINFGRNSLEYKRLVY